MKNHVLILLVFSLIQYKTTLSKNIFAKLLCCCKAQNESRQQPAHAAPAQVSAAPGAPTPNSSSGSHMSGFLKVMAVDHPQGHIAPNPAPASAIH